MMPSVNAKMPRAVPSIQKGAAKMVAGILLMASKCPVWASAVCVRNSQPPRHLSHPT